MLILSSIIASETERERKVRIHRVVVPLVDFVIQNRFAARFISWPFRYGN